MELVKDTIGMNYYWLISNCSFSSVFAFLLVLHVFYLCFFCNFLFVFVSLLLCFLLLYL